MRIRLENGLPYVTISLSHRGQQLELENVLLDTGSAGTIFSADKVLALGLRYETDDTVHRIRGVGGAEFVFSKQVDHVFLGHLTLSGFEIEIGAMDYGFEFDGILGTDFLLQVRAVIDLDQLQIHSSPILT